jgi:wobble nucleotide-excising tRNase
MISKVKRLRSIGKFYDFSSRENALDWYQNTFVFGPNAYGKSTLVNVLRALRDNDPKLIRARRTLGAATEPDAVIVIDSVNHCFNGTRWDRPFPSIQIFDVPFIQANIIAREIGHEQKKNIHRIIIGAQGIRLAEELAALKTKEKARSQEAEALADQFKQGGLTVAMEAFLAIPPEAVAEVDTRIQKFELDIKSKESEVVVQALGVPEQVAAPSLDTDTIKNLAAKNLAVAHEAAEKHVLAHIASNLKDKTQARGFIRQGLDLMLTNCPFCGQDLKNAGDLLKAYREFFDEAFRTYHQDMARQIATIGKWNLENDLTTIASTHNANVATVRQWEPYIGLVQLPDVAAEVDKRRARLTGLKSNVQSALGEKQRDPTSDTDLADIDDLAAELASLNGEVERYNKAVSDLADKAKRHVADLPQSNVASIRAALLREQEVKKRFTPEWTKWAAEYPVAKKATGVLQIQKNAKQKELEDYSRTIFETYQARINALLATLGADFSLTGLTGKTDERANESYSDFGLLILQQTVPLTPRQDEAPCFRNTLSEGDKSTLAFAFFMASLEKMLDLNKQIVVFDDPLSSLDETRREATARLLLDLSPRVRQLNVFTHKKDFLHMLCDKMPTSKTLQLRFDRRNGSRLADLDMEEDRKSDHARLVENLERYLTEDFGPAAETMQGNLRKLFETVLKTKYYPTLAVDIRAKHGLATLLTTLLGAGRLDPALTPRLFDLCSVTSGPHHGDIVDAPSRKLTRDELLPLIREALDLVQKV